MVGTDDNRTVWVQGDSRLGKAEADLALGVWDKETPPQQQQEAESNCRSSKVEAEKGMDEKGVNRQFNDA